MNLFQITGETDTFQILWSKVHALGNVTLETLEFVEANKDREVITSVEYVLQCNFSSDKDKEVINSSRKRKASEYYEDEPWSFTTKTNKKKVKDMMNQWRYTGEHLEADSTIQHDDLSLRTYENIGRVSHVLQQMGRTYFRHMTDNSETRADLRRVLTNMEIVQVKIGEIHEQVFDV